MLEYINRKVDGTLPLSKSTLSEKYAKLKTVLGVSCVAAASHPRCPVRTVHT